MLNAKPLSNNVFILLEDADKTTSGGIVLPDTSVDKTQVGEVVAVGPGREDTTGKVATKVKVGDRVLLKKYGFEDVMIESVKYKVGSEDGILAIL